MNPFDPLAFRKFAERLSTPQLAVLTFVLLALFIGIPIALVWVTQAVLAG
jgi:hypothetical protein